MAEREDVDEVEDSLWMACMAGIKRSGNEYGKREHIAHTQHTHNTHKPYTNLTNDCDINKKKMSMTENGHFRFLGLYIIFSTFFFILLHAAIALHGVATPQ